MESSAGLGTTLNSPCGCKAHEELLNAPDIVCAYEKAPLGIVYWSSRTRGKWFNELFKRPKEDLPKHLQFFTW